MFQGHEHRSDHASWDLCGTVRVRKSPGRLAFLRLMVPVSQETPFRPGFRYVPPVREQQGQTGDSLLDERPEVREQKLISLWRQVQPVGQVG